MHDDGIYRGHRLVDVVSPHGLVYRLPAAYRNRSISEVIRRLSDEGWSRAEISKITGIRYQHVRNVLEQQQPMRELASPSRSSPIGLEDPSVAPRPANAPGDEVKAGTIGEVLAHARRRIANLAGVPKDQVAIELRLKTE